MSFVTTRYASSPQQLNRRAVAQDTGTHEAALETYHALPVPDHVYSDYDFEIIAEIISQAEQQTQALARKGKGLGEVTLQRLLKAYEQVLPRYQVKPQEDIYYYRFLLKLSLDPDPNWWAKFYRECQGQAAAASKASRQPMASHGRLQPSTATRFRDPSPAHEGSCRGQWSGQAAWQAPSPAENQTLLQQRSAQAGRTPGQHAGVAGSAYYRQAPTASSIGDGGALPREQGVAGGSRSQSPAFGSSTPARMGPIGPGPAARDACPASARVAGFRTSVAVPTPGTSASQRRPSSAASQHQGVRSSELQQPPGASAVPTGPRRPSSASVVAYTPYIPRFDEDSLVPGVSDGSSGGAATVTPALIRRSGEARAGPEASAGGVRSSVALAAVSALPETGDDKPGPDGDGGAFGACLSGPSGSGRTASAHTDGQGSAAPAGSADLLAQACDFVMPDEYLGVGAYSQAGIRDLVHRRAAARSLGNIEPHPGWSGNTGGDGQGSGVRDGGVYHGYPDHDLGGHAGRVGLGGVGGVHEAKDIKGNGAGGVSYHLGHEASEMSVATGTSQGSEAEAYLDFQRTAKSFRTWRDHAYIIRESRNARDEAVANWNVALAFWELHLTRRCFRRWACYKQQALALVLEQWHASSLRTCFKRWQELAKYLKVAGLMSTEHSKEKALRKCLTWWCMYTEMRRVKDSKVLKALALWTGNTRKAVFVTWRLMTQQAIASGHHADSYYEAQARGKLLKLWQGMARQQRQMRHAQEAITLAVHSRLATCCLSHWRAQWQTNSRHRQLLSRATAAMRHRELHRAFVSLQEYAGKKQQRREEMLKAAGHWQSGQLAACWNSWLAFLDSEKSRQGKMEHALAYLTNRCQAQAWQSWLELVRQAREKLQLAQEHYRAHGSPLQQGYFEHWRRWHQHRVSKAQRLADAREQLAALHLHRIMMAWHIASEQCKRDLRAFDAIVKMEVRRLSAVAGATIAKICRTRAMVQHASAALAESAVRRVLREWRAVSRMRRQRRRRWAQIVGCATAERRRRVLHAWRLVTAIKIEQRLLVLDNVERRQRGMQAMVLGALKLYVRWRVHKRAAMLNALLHWDFHTKGRAMSGWKARLLVGRAKRHSMQRAERHHRTRTLHQAFGVWLRLYQGVQDKTKKALMHWSGRADLLLSSVLHAWREAARVRAVKSAKVRLAVAHWMGGRLAIGFYTWHSATQRWLVKKAQAQVAVAKWAGGLLYKAFTWWKEWALRKVLLNRKARAYLALLLGRAAAFAFFMLRSNAVRKRKNRGAWVHHCRVMLRTALQGWKLRVFVSAELQARLQLVGQQALGDLLRSAFDSWQLAVQLGASKQDLVNQALTMWVHRRLAAAFRALRTYQLRKHMSRALLLKYRVGLVGAVMREWHAIAQHRAVCNAKVASMLYRTARQLQQTVLDAWQDYMQLKRMSQQRKMKAIGHMRNLLMGRAWNAWLMHHGQMGVARRAILHMLRLRLGQAFNAWWGAVLERHAVLQQLDLVVRRLRHHNMLQAFNMLLAHVESRRRKRAAAAHYFNNRFRTIFHAWRVGAKLEMALNLWAGNVLGLAFAEWRGRTEDNRRLRYTAQHVVLRWRQLELATAFQAWLGAVRSIKKAVLHWRQAGLGAAFNGWRAYLAWKQHMRYTAGVLVAQMAGATMLRAFNSWRCFMAMRARAAMGQRHAEVACLRRAFLPWLSLTMAKVQAADRAEELYEHITATLAAEMLGAVFAAWRHHAHTMPGLRAILGRVLGRHLALAFGGWRDVAETEKQQRLWGAALAEKLAGRPVLRQRCIAAVNRWAAWPLSYAFYTWLSRVHDHDDLQHRATLAVFSYAGSLLRKAWVAWRGYATAKAGLRKRMMEVIGAMGGLRLARSFFWWLALAKYLGHMKECVEAIQGRIAARIVHGVWQEWRQRVHYSRAGRWAMARLAMRTQLATLQQWQVNARHRAEQRAKVQYTLGKMQHRVLAAGFSTWIEWAQESTRLRHIMQQVVGRLMQSTKASAWAGWIWYVQQRAAKRDRLAAVLEHWGANTLRKAFNTWRAAWQDATCNTLAAVHYYGGLLDRCWLAWREAVADAEVTRGVSSWRRLVGGRALACWHAYVHDARQQHHLAAGVSTLVVCQKLIAWRHVTRAHIAMRRLYMRRALLGWCMRTIHWQQQRQQLLHATQVLLFGTLARCFLSWLQLVREQAAKQVVFAQKQSALQEALRFGERLRQRHNAELLATTFHAWHFKTGIYRAVAVRFASVCQRAVSACFLKWHAFVVERRRRLRTAMEQRRRTVLQQALAGWRETANKLREMTALFEGVSEEHWYVTCASKALLALRSAADAGVARRHALKKVLTRKFQMENKMLLSETLRALHALMVRKLHLADLADAASKSRTKRIMSDVINVWHTYTVAMRSDLNPASPFLSPRSRKDDRTLIRNVATFVGSPEARAISEGSSAASREDLDQMHEVMTRREAYLRMASPPRTAHHTGVSGASSAVGNLSFRSGVSFSPRTTSGGDDPPQRAAPAGAVQARPEYGAMPYNAEWEDLGDDRVPLDLLYQTRLSPQHGLDKVAVRQGFTPPVFRGFDNEQPQPYTRGVTATAPPVFRTPGVPALSQQHQALYPQQPSMQHLHSRPGVQDSALLTSGWSASTPASTTTALPTPVARTSAAPSAAGSSILTRAVQLQAASASRRSNSLYSAQALARNQPGRGE